MSNSQERSSCARGTTAARVRCRHCSRMIPADALEEHDTFFCSLKPVRCLHIKVNGEMCGFVCCGTDALMDHHKTCKDYPRRRRSGSGRDGVSPRGAGSERSGDMCENCLEMFRDLAELTAHQATCSLKSVPCPLQCGEWMPRGEVPDHILHTAGKHKPLRRPSVSDYGADNIHMVVAVLMEALQNAKMAQRKARLAPVGGADGALKSIETLNASILGNTNLSGSDSILHGNNNSSSSMSLENALTSPLYESSVRLVVAAAAARAAVLDTSVLTMPHDDPNALSISSAASPSSPLASVVMEAARRKSEEADNVEEQRESLSIPEDEMEKRAAHVSRRAAKTPPDPAAGAKHAKAAEASPEPSRNFTKGRSHPTTTATRRKHTTTAGATAESPARANSRVSLSIAALPASKVRYEDLALRSTTSAVRVLSAPPSVRRKHAHAPPATASRTNATAAPSPSARARPRAIPHSSRSQQASDSILASSCVQSKGHA